MESSVRITVHFPQGFRSRSAEFDGEKLGIASQRETATVRIVPQATKTVEWAIKFSKQAKP